MSQSICPFVITLSFVKCVTGDVKVEEWISTFSSLGTQETYGSSFKRFLEFVGKSGTEIIAEQRQLVQNPDTIDTYPLSFPILPTPITFKSKIDRVGKRPSGRCDWENARENA
jgi:hypothetical protein